MSEVPCKSLRAVPSLYLLWFEITCKAKVGATGRLGWFGNGKREEWEGRSTGGCGDLGKS